MVFLALIGCSSNSGTPSNIPDLALVTDHDQSDQEQAIAAQLEEDETTLSDFFLTHASSWDPDTTDTTVSLLPDGNILHTITLNDDRTRQVITLGRKNSIHAMAEGLRVFPTWDNQLNIYKRLYNTITSPDIRGTLGLVDPSLVESNPGDYSVEQIDTWNRGFIEYMDTIIDAIAAVPFTPSPIIDCSQDTGTDADSDRSGCDPACGFQAGGIFSNHTWNHKDALSCVKDQGPTRGTCCAFSVVSATEYWVKRNFEIKVNLSEQALYNQMCLRWVRSDFVDGYYISNALDYAINEGYLIPFEDQWNYNPSLNRINLDGGGFSNSCVSYVETCSDTAHQSEYGCNSSGEECGYYVPEKNPNHYGYRLKSGHVIWDFNQPETSLVRVLIYLALGDPVLIQVPVLAQFDAARFDGFVQYVAGDVDGPPGSEIKSSNRGNHIMHVVSYIDNEDLATILPDAPAGSGGGYLIVKNSWSNCWGDGGYVYLPYDFVKEYGQYGSVLTAIY